MLAKKIIVRGCIVMCAVFTLTACHQKVAQVTEMDRDLPCTALLSEIVETEKVKAKIESKRGFSARNVGLAIFFWPGVVINEVTGNAAETKAENRIAALKNMYSGKQCSRHALADAEYKLAKDESNKADADSKLAQAESNKVDANSKLAQAESNKVDVDSKLAQAESNKVEPKAKSDKA